MRLMGVLMGFLVAAVASAQQPGQSLTYTTPTKVAVTISADGLSSVRVGEREVAKGAWRLFNGEGWFKDGGSGAVKVPAPAQSTIEVIDPRRARVRHVAGDAVAVYDYAFDGEDLLISARIENNHADSPLNVAGFSGLTFLFDQVPAGLMSVQHISYFKAHGLGLCHPGHWSPIGGSYATDGSIGIGVSPWKTGLARTLILWDYGDWGQGKRENWPQRKLIYFANTPIPPRGAATVDLALRFSTNRDWKHLLEPYRKHFQATFGPVRYKSDHRWIATEYLNHSQKAVSPTNPYGFHGQHRRIDTEAGAKLFCDTVIPKLKEANGQGIIVWGQGGDDPRGGMYRPDFDVLPPEVEANWPAIAQRFKDAGVKLGVTTRPRHMAIRRDWKQDAIIDINPHDEGHRQMLWRRFERMNKLGCTLYYLDSFGDSFEDVVLMRHLREKLGPDVLTFAEHQCDAMLPFSGGYSETTYNGDGTYRLWSGLSRWEVYQWLAPGCQMASRLYEVKGKWAADSETPDHYFLKNHITPLIPMGNFSRLPDLMKNQALFLDASGQWK